MLTSSPNTPGAPQMAPHWELCSSEEQGARLGVKNQRAGTTTLRRVEYSTAHQKPSLL